MSEKWSGWVHGDSLDQLVYLAKSQYGFDGWEAVSVLALVSSSGNKPVTAATKNRDGSWKYTTWGRQFLGTGYRVSAKVKFWKGDSYTLEEMLRGEDLPF